MKSLYRIIYTNYDNPLYGKIFVGAQEFFAFGFGIFGLIA